MERSTPVAHRLSRRRWLQFGALAGAAPWVLPHLGRADDPHRPSQLIAGKSDDLVIHSADPVVLGTPDAVLAQGQVTPKEKLFVRNNFLVPGYMTLEPKPLAGWQIEFSGLIGEAKTLAATELEAMPQTDRELVLQCSGNGRILFSKIAPTQGTQWQRGGIGNVRMSGVLLSEVLERLGIEIDAGAKYLTAEGLDAPSAKGKPDFEHSIPLDVAMERSLLVLRLGDEPLPAVHGGPVRLVTPGYYATMNVKWLTRLRFDVGETTNHYQLPQYRFPNRGLAPGEEFEYSLENSRPNYDLRIASRILTPADGTRVAAGRIEARGLAWNDGAAPIEAVEVSLDGRTWQATELQRSSSPWAWQRWRWTADLKPGTTTLRCRAIDRLGRSQPPDGTTTWNPHGYGWHAVDSVQLNVT
ncbi:MAG: sulfite oxidase [Pirellulales bacterium]|nr:sulfite oxidase [Pirellulales bacterium]